MFKKTSRRGLGRSGFGAVGVLAVIVVLAVIGAAGYAVYHHDHKTTKQSSASASGANGGKGGNSKKTGPVKTEAFLIPEWNVTADIPVPPKNAALIQYQILSGTTAGAGFTTQELIDSGGDSCGAGHMPGGVISRAKPGDTFYLPDGTSSGLTVADQLASGSFKPYTLTGGYYYWYTHPQAACGDPKKTKDLQTAAIAQVQQIVSHLKQAQ